MTEPIYRILKKGVEFQWGPEQAESMHALKDKLISPPALVTLDYSKDAAPIILAVDASLEGWGAALMRFGRASDIRYRANQEYGRPRRRSTMRRSVNVEGCSRP